jgi:hypothetical protein
MKQRHWVAIATVSIALTVAACSADSTTSAEQWSEELQTIYTEVCVGVAGAVGVTEPDRHCACTLAELQDEYTEEEYRAEPACR